MTTTQSGEIELIAENDEDNFLLGKLAMKVKDSHVYPPGNGSGRSLRFNVMDLARLAVETRR